MSLRAFRIEKKTPVKDPPSISENGSSPVTNENHTPEKPVLDKAEKEFRLVSLRKANPDYDIMAIQDALLKNEWDLVRAEKHLKENSRPKIRYGVVKTSPISASAALQSPPRQMNKQTTPVKSQEKVPSVGSEAPEIIKQMQIHQSQQPVPVTNGNAKSSFRRIKKPDSDRDSEDDFDDKPSQAVFDSDESDDDAEFMTKERKEVFEFMNNAKVTDLINVKSLSQRKADILLELRPFTSWPDLLSKMKANKYLSMELLNNCQDFLCRRNNLTNIMKKCQKIVKKIGKAVESGQTVPKPPALLSSELKLSEYQLIGLNWLAILHKNDVNGILADEMGLGKTVQVISFLAYLKENNLAKRTHLIVVPSSTLNNWDQELSKWCPDLTVLKYYGSQDERRSMRIQIAKQGMDEDIMLTTYHMIGASNEEKKMFRVTKFHYVVFDEAHMLKNMLSQRYILLQRIDAANRILLTGTPLQNNLLELMSLLCFVMPSMFAGKAEDIKALFQNKAKKGEETTADELEQQQIEQAKQIMKPFILRRLKKDVLSFLPAKKEEIMRIDLNPSQRQKYDQLVQEYKSEARLAQAEREISGMTFLMDLRKLANHPLLLRYYFTDEQVHKMAKALARDPSYKNTKPEEIFQDIAPLSDFKLYQMAEKHHSLINLVRIPDEYVLDAGKFKILDELLPKLKEEGHRVLIFSQFTMMLDVIEKYLEIRRFGFLRLDGQTAVEDRQDMINMYNKDPNIFIFLLSTRAGGLGINLTSADTVIIYDIDFNPYNDKQAEDRCHRIGQTKEVTIYKLIANNTIDEAMLSIAQDKLKLEQEVTSEEAEEKETHKCVVKLLTLALGTDETRAEHMLSPSKEMPLTKKARRDDADD
ncbi:SWI/SNF-related matrix-associated actin-dependent regulator of chromatin subfamily A containing DEAD/H box 1 homolog [Culicoides brevitarsis]|uniref:SWI/SNF-related matrix-associated actin-dependent regulator of chromatin subfamily A containing DEAD/H box 1 homolog n=1 Tax=Culicoides brevitarsis TaxID=469753 RepID=UPI00307BF835